MADAVPSNVQLAELTQVAYRLGKAFGQAAEQAETHERRLEFFSAFDRAFFSVRVGIALQLRLRREAAVPAEREAEREDERAEPLERDPAETGERYTERDRDRDVERASFPVLLRTLEGVADAAARLPGPPPAELPTLRELLAQVAPTPEFARARVRPQTALRARLTGSGASVALAPSPARRTPHDPLAHRRATGPPG
ncbi:MULTISPECIES: hypothetical protein [unclassified Phenylobacterium]|uniref:hypothetical protein n=1 Tax=unclassified Phenylobacterium TaxID=2640670 RepID=UPI0012E732DD|nr:MULTISPECIES: hypothetical protein [unclassified Phenylobacterium]